MSFLLEICTATTYIGLYTLPLEYSLFTALPAARALKFLIIPIRDDLQVLHSFRFVSYIQTSYPYAKRQGQSQMIEDE